MKLSFQLFHQMSGRQVLLLESDILGNNGILVIADSSGFLKIPQISLGYFPLPTYSDSVKMQPMVAWPAGFDKKEP